MLVSHCFNPLPLRTGRIHPPSLLPVPFVRAQFLVPERCKRCDQISEHRYDPFRLYTLRYETKGLGALGPVRPSLYQLFQGQVSMHAPL